jgi:hypothetical protein
LFILTGLFTGGRRLQILNNDDLPVYDVL